MSELLFLIVFIAILILTGLTIKGVLLAIVVAAAVLFLLGMVGLAIKLLPWVIVVALGIWFYKKYMVSSR